MKTLILALVLVFSASNLRAQSFHLLTPQVAQGDTFIARIAPQYQGRLVCLFSFGIDYLPNKYGYIFIGIGTDAKPGRYPISLVECGSGIILDGTAQNIEIVQKVYPETKIRRRLTPVNTARRRQEVQAMMQAYTRSVNWEWYPSGNFVNPLDNIQITDKFGKKRIYLNGESRHGGVDLKAPVGTRVRAINSGTVLMVANNFSLEGNMVIIDHGSNILSFYLHLSRIYMKEGQTVSGGDEIGLSGATGAVTGPHLHFIVKVLGINVDPLGFIETINSHETR